MANMEIKDALFELPIAISESGTVEKTLLTQDTYVDKNIKIIVETPDAVLETKDAGEVTATVSTTDTVYTSSTETDYAIVINADAHVSDVVVGVKDAGFAAESDTVTVAGSDAKTDSKTLYIKAGSLSGEGDAAAEGFGGLELGAKSTTAPTSGFYIKASASGSVGVATAGWVDPEKNEAVDTNAEAYYPVAAVTLANAATEGKSYTEKNAPILVSGKGLYINEGYIENTYIPLADLVPDEGNVKAGEDGNSHLIYNTVSVYDNDGNLVAGTMGDAELSAITAKDANATVASVEVAALEDGSAFAVTGSHAISGNASVEITANGYATTDLKATGAIAGEAKVDATIAKIGIGVETSGNDGEVVPVISKEDSSTAKSGAATKTQPTEGKYIAVSTAEIKEVVDITPVVLTEGYGTADVHSATAGTVNAGAAASGVYYIPVEMGSHSIEEGTSDIVKATTSVDTEVVASDARAIAGVLSAAPSGAYLKIDTATTATAGSVQTSSTCTITEGYQMSDVKTTNIKEDVEVVATEAASKYIRIYEGAIL